jgi:hypothetical protein
MSPVTPDPSINEASSSCLGPLWGIGGVVLGFVLKTAYDYVVRRRSRPDVEILGSVSQRCGRFAQDKLYSFEDEPNAEYIVLQAYNYSKWVAAEMCVPALYLCTAANDVAWRGGGIWIDPPRRYHGLEEDAVSLGPAHIERLICLALHESGLYYYDVLGSDQSEPDDVMTGPPILWRRIPLDEGDVHLIAYVHSTNSRHLLGRHFVCKLSVQEGKMAISVREEGQNPIDFSQQSPEDYLASIL